MSPITYSVGVTFKAPEGTIANTTDSFTGNAAAVVDALVPAATTDQAEACAVHVANVIALCLFSAVALTVKTYAAGVLKQTITLPAGKELEWDEHSAYANPFTEDFDTVKLTNADSAKSTTFKARFLHSN